MMGFLIKLLTTLSVGALCALDAEGGDVDLGPPIPKKRIPPAFLGRTDDIDNDDETGDNEEIDTEETIKAEESVSTDSETPMPTEVAAEPEALAVAEAPAAQRAAVPEQLTTPENDNFSEYLQSLIEELDAKARESESEAAQQKAAKSSPKEPEEEVSLSDVVDDIAQVLARNLPQPVNTFSVQSAAGDAGINTSSSTTTVSPPSGADSPFRLIGLLGMMAISAAAFLLV